MVNITGRHKGFPWFRESRVDVLIGGAGGIGSWLALFLARANFRVNIYDMDTIEPHNIGGQAYKVDDIGKVKVQAVNDVVEEFADTYVNAYNQKIDSNTPLTDIDYYFSAFDNIEARKILFRHWLDHTEGTENATIFIDGRLSGEQFQVICVRRGTDDVQRYIDDFLNFNSEDIQPLPCTATQTSHIGAHIAAVMTGFFTNFLTNVYAEEEVREVPFLYEFVLPFNLTLDE